MDTNNLPNDNNDISKRTGEKVEDYFSRLVQQDYTLKTTYQDVVIDNVTLTLENSIEVPLICATRYGVY